jgi:hypothetical protein
MGLDIGIKFNKEIVSKTLSDKFSKSEEKLDNLYCLSRGYCHMIMMKEFSDGEPVIEELEKALDYDCSFIQEPKANHYEEGDDTLFQFGWVNSIDFLKDLTEVQKMLKINLHNLKKLNLEDNWVDYFNEKGEYGFKNDIDNLMEVLDIANKKGVTEICYTIG